MCYLIIQDSHEWGGVVGAGGIFACPCWNYCFVVIREMITLSNFNISFTHWYFSIELVFETRGRSSPMSFSPPQKQHSTQATGFSSLNHHDTIITRFFSTQPVLHSLPGAFACSLSFWSDNPILGFLWCLLTVSYSDKALWLVTGQMLHQVGLTIWKQIANLMSYNPKCFNV